MDWLPGLNESAGKKSPCGITKQGSKHLRTILVEIAQVVAKMSKNNLSSFFHRLRARKNYNVAISFVLARKLISIIFHLLINQELYQEDNCKRLKQNPSRRTLRSSKEEQFKDGVAAIVDAFITSRKNLR